MALSAGLLTAATAVDMRNDIDRGSGLPDAITRQLGLAVRAGLIVIDANVVRYANPMAAAMYGRSDGSLVGLPVAATVAPAFRAEVYKQTRRRLAGDAGHAYDVRGLRADGSEFDLRVWGQHLVHEGRALDLATLTDVTELKEAVRRA